ncbi:hypothetical protein [Nocardioides sp.]|uniref:hypothetical protein n=1 Tax=Nocardioides sp. TaxID=35761 RepID=UPI0025E03191|nr:hypothetical protein [Nocardioides sp.]
MATIHGIEATPDELRALALIGYGHFTSMHVEEGGFDGMLFTDPVSTEVSEGLPGKSASSATRAWRSGPTRPYFQT